jgi:cholesterol oxidase
MGRDLYRGRLELRDEFRGRRGMKHDQRPASRLTAHLPGRLLDSSGASQEQVLRAIAATAWNGELRANPAWTTLGKRITVHSQGGCPMGDEDESVTDVFGEVRKYRGVYVMDAAAFPVSVGVNPSATIAAIAEWKIEQFLIRTSSDAKRAAVRDRYQQRRDAASAWVDKHGRAALDPLNDGTRPASSDVFKQFKPLGLTFSEHVSGYLSEAKPVDMERLNDFPDAVEQFTKAEQKGIETGSTLALCLDASTDDLAALIAGTRTAVPHRMQIRGKATLEDKRELTVSGDSYLELFVRPERPTTPPTLFFRYRLQIGDGNKIDGLKMLQNEPGFDLWTDTSTIYVQMTNHGKTLAGVVRVSLRDFLEKQLRSMDITNTKDDARRCWALAAFYKYFVGELATVYVTRAEAIQEFFKKLLTEIHV